MHEIDASNAAEYLRDSVRAAAGESVEVRELAGGVSNVVLHVTLPERGARFVLKQARGRLRVKEDWRCPIERIWREVEVLEVCGSVLRSAPAAKARFRPAVPEVLWEDRENYCYAMTAAPTEHYTWKELLLAGWGSDHLFIAATCGRLLGRLHAGTWRNAALAQRFEDRSFFDQLRLDPYYRQAARVHTDLAPQLSALVDSVWQHPLCLVHGDFSPKNLLVSPGQALLIDFEVGHFGDPAFDLGFFLTHLVAKAVRAREQCRKYLLLVGVFWFFYRRELQAVASPSELDNLKRRMMLNLAGCLLARADGKSPLEYLTDAERSAIRTLGREWLVNPPDRLTSED
jgi:aminoglycoside phosphotransferase (APT) family kinase protein